MLVLGATAVPVCFFLAFLTANPCGAFGDHCTNYGQTSEAANVFLIAAVVAAAVALAGLVLLIIGLFSRSR